MCGCCMPKEHCIAMACDSISHTIILRRIISMELIIKKIAGLEIMTLNGQKM